MPDDIATAYLAPEGFLKPMLAELEGELTVNDRLVLSPDGAQTSFWAENVWLAPEKLAIRSIKDAAGQLKARQRNWWPYTFCLHRRGALIQEALPHISVRPMAFPAPLPAGPLGSWTLLDKDTLLASAKCQSPFPNGALNFQEDKVNPPSRAYLKLWEAWTRLEARPQAGEFCLDAGGSPGGWAWAAASLGARVLSVDRAPLAERVAVMPGVAFERGDAFSLKPSALARREARVHWFLSDVICYPEKLYDWVGEWLESGLCDNFICTLKFQEGDDYRVARKFARIPGSQVFHLFHNRHELTWARLAPRTESSRAGA